MDSCYEKSGQCTKHSMEQMNLNYCIQEKNITVSYINQHNWAKKKLYRYLNKNILVSNSFTHKTFQNKDKIMTKYWNFACRCNDLERKKWISH